MYSPKYTSGNGMFSLQTHCSGNTMEWPTFFIMLNVSSSIHHRFCNSENKQLSIIMKTFNLTDLKVPWKQPGLHRQHFKISDLSCEPTVF